MVLAAGKGTRLFPLTGEIPKPMAPVVDTPIIEHIFALLAGHGVKEAHVNVSYLADTLLGAYGEGFETEGMSVHLSREEELLGTAGGVKRLEDRFDETFVVVSGDALTDVDLTSLVQFHKRKDALATIALRRVYDTSEFGVVELDEESNIKGFQEKPDPGEAISTLANTGVYVFEPRALSPTSPKKSSPISPRTSFRSSCGGTSGSSATRTTSTGRTSARSPPTARRSTTCYRAGCAPAFLASGARTESGSARTPRSTLQPLWKATSWSDATPS